MAGDQAIGFRQDLALRPGRIEQNEPIRRCYAGALPLAIMDDSVDAIHVLIFYMLATLPTGHVHDLEAAVEVSDPQAALAIRSQCGDVVVLQQAGVALQDSDAL